ncbi:MAG: NFACT family protein [Acidaminococcaceae bacterium]|jgi:predicted ribosome quality control (RQC) complex YloA/Tae2 family protein|nr:NFACT family protein [Acidaminococcaceae bacterium]
MNLEGITLAQLTGMLKQEILGGIIYKISMPTSHAVLLQLRREQDTLAVLLDLSGSAPAIYLPDKLPANPDTPPAFCMLLRKQLEEGRITNIEQVGLDRILILEVDLLGAGARITTKKLVVELTGKNANLILTEKDTIIDSLKHISAQINSYRVILPGQKYLLPPPQKGLPVLGTDSDTIVTSLPDVVDRNLLHSFITTTTGIGKASAEQIFYQAGIPAKATFLTPSDRHNLQTAVAKLQKDCAAGTTFSVLISAQNRCQTIFPYPAVFIPKGSQIQTFTKLNDALLFAVQLEPIQLPEHDLLQKTVTAEIQKLQKKLQALQSDLAKADKAEDQKFIADTLMANLYQLKQGQTHCELPSIYTGERLQITLNPNLNPSGNAQHYYKRYNKFKRAQEEIQGQLQTTLATLDYLNSIDASLLSATTRPDVEDIKQELRQAGFLPTPRKKQIPAGKSQPLRLAFSKQTTIYIGKNNKQNDYVTFKLGTGNDYWLHTKNIPGSHVLIKTNLPAPEQEALQAAVLLAAYFSKGRAGSQVPVDCAQRKYVKKPAGSKPGFVIYTHQTTYYATPEAKKVQALLTTATKN